MDRTTVTPILGERFSTYLERVAQERLINAGASLSEAYDLSSIATVEINPEYLPTWSAEDAASYLEIWREGRRRVAGYIREDRAARLAAGYRGLEVDAPVYLSGRTAW